MIDPPPFRIGRAVRIRRGILAGYDALLEALVGDNPCDQYIKVRISIGGRETVVDLPLEAVESKSALDQSTHC